MPPTVNGWTSLNEIGERILLQFLSSIDDLF